MVSIMPGMDLAEPERTLTKEGRGHHAQLFARELARVARYSCRYLRRPALSGYFLSCFR